VSHIALGSVRLWRLDHAGALAQFRRMIALDPNFAQGHFRDGGAEQEQRNVVPPANKNANDSAI
jgi:hypothetical protein